MGILSTPIISKLITWAPAKESLYSVANDLEPSNPSSSPLRATKIISLFGAFNVEKLLASSNKNEIPEALSKAPQYTLSRESVPIWS